MKKSKSDISVISRYRNEMFGWAAISIIVFHFFGYYKIYGVNGGWSTLLKVSNYFELIIGSVGVEIFLFLSGMGLYFSMRKDNNIKKFYAKRFKRLGIPYLILGAVVWIIKDFILGENRSIIGFLLDYSTLSYWLQGNYSYWFITFIGVMYLIFPILFFVIDKNKYKILTAITAVLASMLFARLIHHYCYWYYSKIEFAITRIPVFIIGIYYGYRIFNHDKFRWYDYALVVMGICIKLMYVIFKRYHIHMPAGANRIAACYFSISIIFLYAMIRSKMQSFKLSGFLVKTGALSLELYMTHVSVIHIYKIVGIAVHSIVNYLILIVISIAASILLNRAANGIIKSLDR